MRRATADLSELYAQIRADLAVVVRFINEGVAWCHGQLAYQCRMDP